MTRAQRNRAALVLGAAIAAALGTSAHAATWDGGDGTWSTADGNWDGGNVWTQGSSAVFNPGPGSVVLGEDISASAVGFNSNNWDLDLNGFDLTVAGNLGSSAAAPGTNTITNTSDTTATLSVGHFSANGGPVLTGNLNVTWAGTSQWTPVPNHTFTGTLRLVGTSVVRSDGNSLGSDTGLLELGGSTTLQLGTLGSAVMRTYSRDIVIETNTTQFWTGGANTLILAGKISGPGRVRIGNSQGTLVLAGDNDYTGVTGFNGAGISLIAAHDNALGQSSGILVDAASTFGLQGNINVGSNTPLSFTSSAPSNGLGMIHNFGGDNTFGGAINNGSNTVRVYGVEPDSSLTLTGVISGAKGVLKTGEGTLILTAANTYGTANATSGNETEVRAGVLRLDFNHADSPEVDIINNGNASNGNQVSHLVLAGGTLELKGKEDAINSQRFKNSSAANSFRVNTGASKIVLIQNGAASLSLNTGRLPEANREVGGTLDFTLPTTGAITFGTSAAGAVGVTDTILLANGAAFATVGGEHWAAMNSSRQIISGHTVAGFYTANTADSLSGNADIAGVDTVLAAHATPTSLRFGEAAARSVDLNGQTLTTGGILVTAGVADNATSITNGTLRGNVSGTGTLQDLVVFQNNTAGTFTIGASITNAENDAATGLTKSGDGTLELAGANSYTGNTVLNEGVLKLNHANALGSGSLIIKGGVLGLTEASGPFTRALGSGAGQVRFLGGGGFAAYGEDQVVNLGGSGATLNWHNTGSAVSHFVTTGSTLVFGAADADGTVVFENSINILPNATSAMTRVIRVNRGLADVDVRMTGAIVGGGHWIKTGDGTLELAGANTWSGHAFLSGGTVLVSGSVGTGAHAIEVNDATLAVTGTGKISREVVVNAGGVAGGSSTPESGTSFGAVTVNAGGTFRLGQGIGTTTTGSVNFAGGTLAGEVDFASGTADQLAVTGTVTANGATLFLDILNADQFETANKTYVLIDNNGIADLINGSGFTVQTSLGSALEFELGSGDGNDLVITFTGMAVPEPASLSLLVLTAGGLLRRRRRQDFSRA